MKLLIIFTIFYCFILNQTVSAQSKTFDSLVNRLKTIPNFGIPLYNFLNFHKIPVLKLRDEIVDELILDPRAISYYANGSIYMKEINDPDYQLIALVHEIAHAMFQKGLNGQYHDVNLDEYLKKLSSNLNTSPELITKQKMIESEHFAIRMELACFFQLKTKSILLVTRMKKISELLSNNQLYEFIKIKQTNSL